MKTLVFAVIRCSLLFLLPTLTYATSTQWDLDPISGDWNTADNWTPRGVPNGPTDITTFGLSNTTAISVSEDTTVNRIIFSPGAAPFTITVNPFISGRPNDNILTLSGAGITNNSGIVQKLVTAAGTNYNYANIVFTNSASAGNSNSFTNTGATAPFTAGGVSGETSFYNTSTAAKGVFTNSGATYLAGYGGFTNFFNSSTAANGTFNNEGGTFTGFGIGSSGGATRFIETSTAANGTFTNNPATVRDSFGGSTQFYNVSTAGNGTFTNNGSAVSGAGSGSTVFYDLSTAANATLTNNGGTVSGAQGGLTVFDGSSSAGSATLIANGGINAGQGGAIFFQASSTGGTPRVEVFGNGNLDISHHDFHGVMVGSIEGDGNISLGRRTLTVGSNDLSTTFSGVIQGGGQNGGRGGSLTKIGSGTLDLTGTNTYTGNTNVNGGVLKVDSSITNNTFVNHGGTLAGTGTVYGNVTNRGTVSPGDPIGTLTVSNYTQTQYANLMIQIANAGQFSVLNVLGSANVDLTGHFKPLLLNGFVPTVGEQFIFMQYGSLLGSFFIFNPNIDGVAEHWDVSYQPTNATLTVAAGNVPVPD
jgi:autotransporter-associated beta strand protein